MTGVELPWPPKDLNPNARVHWARRNRATKAYREQCYWLTVASKIMPPASERVSLRLDFYPPDRRHRDDDNMLASCKAARDGLADALGINDKRFETTFAVHRDDTRGCIVAQVGAI